MTKDEDLVRMSERDFIPPTRVIRGQKEPTMLIDFLIGFGAVNALPHYLFGRMKIGVLSLFGFSPLGNYCYAAFCLVMSLGLFAYKYGFGAFGEHMMLVGVLWVVFAYLVLWDFICRHLRKDP